MYASTNSPLLVVYYENFTHHQISVQFQATALQPVETITVVFYFLVTKM